MNFRIFDKKIMEKVTKKLIQSAPMIFILATITVLTGQLANPYQQSVAHLVYSYFILLAHFGTF